MTDDTFNKAVDLKRRIERQEARLKGVEKWCDEFANSSDFPICLYHKRVKTNLTQDEAEILLSMLRSHRKKHLNELKQEFESL